MTIGSYAIASEGIASFGVDYAQLTQSVASSPLLDKIAKEAIQEFLKQTFKVLWENLDQLRELTPPETLLQWWDTFLQIIQNLPF